MPDISPELIVDSNHLDNQATFNYLLIYGASLVAQTVKNLPAMQETLVRSLSQEDPLEEEWQPISVFLLGESHGQKSSGAVVHGVAKSWT